MQIRGDLEGQHTLFWVHGSPSCRLEATFMDEAVFQKLGIRLIAFDRPGYGQSEPHRQRSFASFAGAPTSRRYRVQGTGYRVQGTGALLE